MPHRTLQGRISVLYVIASETPRLPLVLAFGAVIAVCGLLWIFPNAVAQKILPSAPAHPDRTSLFEDWFSVGCSLIGVWALAKAIPALASYLLVNYIGYKIYPDSFSVNPDWPLHVAFNVLQLLFGTWLFLGARGLKKVLEWARQS